MRTQARLFPVLIALLVGACSSAKRMPGASADAKLTTDDAVVHPPASNLIDRAATAVCGALFRCCNADLATYFAAYESNELLKDFRPRLPPADEASCRQVVGEMFQIVPFGDWMRAIESGSVTFDEPAFAHCVAALDEATCGEASRAALWDSTCLGFAPPEGGEVQRAFVHRTRGAGQTCTPIRDGVGASFYGTCDPTTTFCCYADPAHPGCQTPFDAAGTARSGQCQAAVGLGGTCAVSPPFALCATGQDCDSSTATCVAPTTTALAVGAACVDANFNVLGVCQDSWCDLLGTGTCKALVENGAPCTGADECRSQHCETTCLPNTLCSGAMGPVDGAPDAGVHDAAPADAPAADGERCTTARDLVASSTASPLTGYTSRVAASFGTSNDYNPLMSSGLPPHCAFAYDAVGNEVVYAVKLAPGDHLRVHAVTADDKQAAVYLLDQCPAAHWTDWDLSGACGSNEYAVGSCGIGGCDPAILDTTYPVMIGGNMTATQTFWLVVDQVNGASSTGFVLDWKITH